MVPMARSNDNQIWIEEREKVRVMEFAFVMPGICRKITLLRRLNFCCLHFLAFELFLLMTGDECDSTKVGSRGGSRIMGVSGEMWGGRDQRTWDDGLHYVIDGWAKVIGMQ